MVLVDTSVWIRFLANRAPFAGMLDELLGRGDVCGHDFVFGELLIGDKAAASNLKVCATCSCLRGQDDDLAN